ncbi:SusC/RagA family TonB-linked outer membrane protein [Niastella caeni]|uniref:SusC/RagA family TonB-linked outer membrane protein n=1 Tax=Niastella caeni TaxID=2569763 RepID=A0A4S8HYL0_9BACT|nr:SusC/RagA family TonB-linked outer membrane protein [Niastella caeni]THU40873.1 SusC/RagA family TonB-linked outer membrane protein [Niastella caeni]
MRKMLSLLAVLVLCTAMALGQQAKTVTGQVKDSKGDPIPFATIKIKGTTNAVAADANGNFSINAPQNSTFIISAVGFEQTELKANSSGTLTVSLNTMDAMSEVVVTALGIKRAKNTLPYAAQTVNGEDVSRLRSGNAFSALSGKVSGLQIQQGNGMGSSTNIVIRGMKSISGSNQALFVVDGVPVDNTINNRSTQQTGRGGYDYGNAASDINPDDIENINVLKGAAATALYGSRAANGVIMITTKKAKRGLGLTVNTGLTVNSIDKKTFPGYQKQYGAGYSDPYQKDGFFYFDVDGDGNRDLVVPTSEDASYGAKFDPNLMVYHWDAFDPASPNYKKARPWVAAENDPSTYYETSLSNNTNIMLDGATDKGSFKLGYTRNDERGVLPNSKLIKNIVNFGASYNITPRLTATASVNYSKIDGKGRYGTGYSGLNVNQNFRQWYQTNVDIKEQKEAYFRNRKNVTWNWKDPSQASGLVPIYTDNYYWTAYENYETDTRQRVFGYTTLDFKATDWLSFLGRISVDNYTELQEERVAVGSNGVASYTRFDRTFTELNYDLMANFDKQLTKDFNLKALLGTNLRRTTTRSTLATTSGGLIVPGLYSIANSKGTVPAPTETYQPIAVDGYFGGITLSYQDYLSLDATFRRDRSSTLPVDVNAYNYYAVSGSWLFSHHLPTVPWLSSGKIRVNYATVGNSAPWGSVKDVYDKPNPFGSTILFSLPDTKNNTNLKPEQTKSREIGLEMAFVKNRLGFDATYYVTNTIDQIIPVSVSAATGYISKYVNAGEIENKGIELTVYGTPVRTQNFSWTVNVNWTRNRNKVLSLYNDSKNLQIGSFQGGVSINASIGQPYGTIQGKTWAMKDGKRLVGDNGYYTVTSTTSNIIGNVNPDWIGGIYNTFKYKDFTLGFLVDMRKGGDVWSLDLFYAQYTGVLKESAGINDLGNPVRNSLADGGGVILDGVDKDGKVNTKRVVIDANSPSNPQANYAYDASYIKLREANISYALPSSVYSKIKAIKGIDISLFGRNLWIIHKNLPYADPEENLSAGNLLGMQSGAYPTTRSIGMNLRLKF